MKKLLAKLGEDKEDSKYLRVELVLGKSAVVVGDKFGDLVLETLGKVYIKSGRSYKLLNDIFDLLDEKEKSKDKDEEKIIILAQGLDIRDLDYPGEGYFIFDSYNEILYISVKGLYVALVNASEYSSDKYVKKTGDTMTGPLSIVVRDAAPLIVQSTRLIENLNSQYINSYSSDKLAKIYVNESIFGKWRFTNLCWADAVWTFSDNVFFNKDIISTGSISTPIFSSGFSGSGWRLDGTTNTLTIDNLVVRKLMKVYEMVINKIRATNGSLWVSNAGKCTGATKLKFVNISEAIDTVNKSFDGIKVGEMFVPVDVYQINAASNKLYVNNSNTIISGELLSTNQEFGNQTTFYDFRYIYKITSSDLLFKKLEKGSIDDLLDIDIVKENYTESIIVTDILSDSDDKNVLDRNSYFTAYIEKPTNALPKAVDIKTYYKYFGCKVYDGIPNYNYWIIQFEDTDYPPFEVGDILRCLKMLDYKSIKYYDALVVKKFTGRSFLIQKALGMFDIYSEVSYDADGNLVFVEKPNTRLYTRSNLSDPETWTEEQLLGTPCKDDDLILIGNILDPYRLGAVYLTSSDDLSPYIEIMGRVNRPDYAVIYKEPDFVMYKGYYVSEKPNDNNLGKFRVYIDNSILLSIEGDIDTEEYTILLLYGYSYPSSACLIRRGEKGSIYKYTQTTKARLGKLDGLLDPILGNNQPHGYGLYSDNVFLTGEFYLNNGKSIASFADDIALLSGEILNIDLEELKSEISESVSTMITNAIEGIENKFSETEEDEEGNEIPAGFAGLFTFDYTDITGDGVLDGKKGLAVLGDSIVFYTSENGKFDFNDPTALIRNKKINADLIDVKELEFDKLVGKSTIDSYEHVITVTYSYDLNTYENVKITGLVGLDYSRPAIGTLSNTLYGGILTLRDFNTEKGHNIKLKEINVDGVFTYDYEVSNRILANVSEVPLGDYISELDANGGEDVSISEIKKNTIEEYTITTINRKSKGESVIYYPDGSILNAKIISTDTSGKVTGCVEYFFAQGKIRIDTLLDKGDEYIVQNFMEGEVLQELYKGGLLKRINYFDFADSFVINWVLYYDRYDTKDEWIALFEDLYMNTGILLNELEEMYDHMVKLDTAAKNGNGKYQSDYSNFVAAVLSSLHGTQGSGKIGKGSGYGSIQSGDKIFFPSGKWYSYDSLLEQKINDSIRNNGNYYDDIKNKNIIEGLYITHYELKDPGTTEGEHNSGNFNILYFNSEKSIEGKITFTIENGNYNGGAGMSPIK